MNKFTKILEQLDIDKDFEEVQNDLLEMVKKSVNSDDTDLQQETMRGYIEDSNTTIIGLVNDSDIFDLYLKHRNQFDKILSELSHFEETPESIGVNNSIYDYIVESTKKAIQELYSRMIKPTPNENNDGILESNNNLLEELSTIKRYDIIPFDTEFGPSYNDIEEEDGIYVKYVDIEKLIRGINEISKA